MNRYISITGMPINNARISSGIVVLSWVYPYLGGIDHFALDLRAYILSLKGPGVFLRWSYIGWRQQNWDG
jgi:hypothetical protein